MPRPDQAFVKRGPESDLDMFEAEAAGLRELEAAGAVRVPKVIDYGIEDGRAFIALERLTFQHADRDAEDEEDSSDKDTFD